MSVATHATTTYGAYAPAIKTPRDIEYSILAKVTGALQSAVLEARGALTSSLAAALHDNQRLWVAFATDLAHPDNEFPKDLRARLFYLAEFAVHETAQILNNNGNAQALIDINTAVMRGLRGVEVRQ